MNTTLTAKLKLLTTPDQFRALRATQLAYRAALNYVSTYAFAHGKTSSGKRLQRATYDDLRCQFGLPAQMACNAPRQVGSTYQALWTKAKKNAEARRLGYTRKRFKGLDKAPPLRLAHPHLQSGPRLLPAVWAGGEPPHPSGTDPRPLPKLEPPRDPAPGGSDHRRSQALV